VSVSGLQLDRLQESLRVPDVLGGRYQIVSVLGRGGMGVVYLAEDARLQRKVALKVIDPALASAELETRLEREAQLLGRLSHPGIVPIYDLGRQDELTLFYVMKHVDGETLERWLLKDQPFSNTHFRPSRNSLHGCDSFHKKHDHGPVSGLPGGGSGGCWKFHLLSYFTSRWGVSTF